VLKRLIPASIVAVAFLFVSIAHACSGLESTSVVKEQSPMNTGDDDSFPCGNEKPDICKSVRDSMLSVKPSVLGIDSLDKTVFSLPISFIRPIESNPASLVLGTETSVHPVFKLPLSLFYLALRI
jgi:hypothetical protein